MLKAFAHGRYRAAHLSQPQQPSVFPGQVVARARLPSSLPQEANCPGMSRMSAIIIPTASSEVAAAHAAGGRRRLRPGSAPLPGRRTDSSSPS